jgi:membrane-associated phospholipid phosphatase
MSAAEGTSTTVLDPRAVYTDPRVDTVWRHDGSWWAPLTRRPHLGAVLLGAGMVTLTVGVAAWKDLPLRDADGIAGKRMWMLLSTLAAFFAIEIVPRAFLAWRAGERGPLRAVRSVLRDRWSRRRLRVVVIGLLAFYATYLSYRNLKSFLPFIVDQDQDGALMDFERALFGGHDPGLLLQDLLGTGTAAHLLSSVYLFYLAFIPISLGAALILASNPVPGMWWVSALGINWTLGVLSYYLLPALGPAFHDASVVAALPETGVSRLQNVLWDHRLEVLADPHASPEVQSIAAFASLHTSVVFSAAIIAHRVRVPAILRWSLWAFLVLVVISTMYFGWHYIVDDVAGLAIGAIAVIVGAAWTGHWNVLWGRRHP